MEARKWKRENGNALMEARKWKCEEASAEMEAQKCKRPKWRRVKWRGGMKVREMEMQFSKNGKNDMGKSKRGKNNGTEMVKCGGASVD